MAELKMLNAWAKRPILVKKTSDAELSPYSCRGWRNAARKSRDTISYAGLVPETKQLLNYYIDLDYQLQPPATPHQPRCMLH
ncbi:hypothetical protein ACFL4X_00220 [Gemmatimonadota bacterium]